MPRRHDADAGGDAALLGEKQQLCATPARRGHAHSGVPTGVSDLELAVAAEARLVDQSTVVVTTVHELRVRPAGAIPATTHDIHVDVVVTPERVVECARPRGHRAPRLRWAELTEEKFSATPFPERLR